MPDVLIDTIKDQTNCKNDSTCGKTIMSELEDAKAEVFVSKKYNFGRSDAGDCELRKSTITIYSDGRYEEISEYHDHGSIFGDTFKVKMSIIDKSDKIVTSWEWAEEMGAGDDATTKISGTKIAIKDKWNDIKSMRRELKCIPRY